MAMGLMRATALGFSLLALPMAGCPSPAAAQASGTALEVDPDGRVDRLVAPIALYPDALLADILMASTYPLEVVEADRWLRDPANAGLHGDRLSVGLEPIDWDPSVKSLAPFPQTLRMMSDKLDWTQALGNAFLADQAAVMDAVQRLRAKARAAGGLASSPQETVSTQGASIVIEPADPRLVYVPYYNSSTVYGGWDYPGEPPIQFPPPLPVYGYAPSPGISFGIGFGVAAGLWGWGGWDWSRHDIHIDADRYNRLNGYAIDHADRPRFTDNTWRHDATQRRGAPYGDPAVRARFAPQVTNGAAARQEFRGREPALPMTPERSSSGRPAIPAARPSNRGATDAPPPPPLPNRGATRAPPPLENRGASHAPAPTQQPVARPRPAAPAFSNTGRGEAVRAQSQRGQASRQSAPVVPPPAPRAQPSGDQRNHRN